MFFKGQKLAILKEIEDTEIVLAKMEEGIAKNYLKETLDSLKNSLEILKTKNQLLLAFALTLIVSMTNSIFFNSVIISLGSSLMGMGASMFLLRVAFLENKQKPKYALGSLFLAVYLCVSVMNLFLWIQA